MFSELIEEIVSPLIDFVIGIAIVKLFYSMGCYLEKSNRAALHLIRKDKRRVNATDETENQSEENYTEIPDTPAEEHIDHKNAIRPSQEMEF